MAKEISIKIQNNDDFLWFSLNWTANSIVQDSGSDNFEQDLDKACSGPLQKQIGHSAWLMREH